MSCEKDLEVKRKLRYYKGVINPNLEDQKYLLVLTSTKKIINIAKIRTNSLELHSGTGHWTIPKTSWVERIFHLCETMSVEDANHFLLDFPTYTHIRSQFPNLFPSFLRLDRPKLVSLDVNHHHHHHHHHHHQLIFIIFLK